MKLIAPEYVIEALEALKASGEVEMHSLQQVVFAAHAAGFESASTWLENLGETLYVHGARYGFEAREVTA